ncbi:MAG: ABC transporter substrate-binding protein [Thermomicrobiales bacterium]
MIEIRGMSWDHARGHDPMVATAAAFAAQRPDVRVTWQTRSLQDFADYPVEKLAELFDLVLIDHPFMGFAAATGCILPVDEHLDAAFLADQAAHSVGPSHGSYCYAGRQWALATDAASHVSAYRPDLLERIGVDVPRTWDAVLALARGRAAKADCRVAVPLIPVDTLMCFLSICANAGEPAFTDDARVVGRAMGRHALETLRLLGDACHPESLDWNPIRAYERMSASDEIAYVPLAFGYANYAEPGFRPHLVRFTDIPAAADGVPRGGILGGVGLVVSATTRHPEAAFAYARFVADAETQRGLYFSSGGQPGHRGAWLDESVNAASSDFFKGTLETLDNAYLRPRYLGFMGVQEKAGELLHRFLRERAPVDVTLDAFDALYRGSRRD